MTLANLLAIQRLQAFSATPQGVQRLLAAAARNLADAQLQQLSAENRFDAALIERNCTVLFDQEPLGLQLVAAAAISCTLWAEGRAAMSPEQFARPSG